MSKSYVLVVQPSGGKNRPLDVDDAMQQILDLIEWLRASARSAGHDTEYRWILKNASTNSPLAVEIEPEPAEENRDIDGIVAEDFKRAHGGMESLLGESATGIPAWLDKKGLEAGKRIFSRGRERIGLTRVYEQGVEDNGVHITPHLSQQALDRIKLYETPANSDIPQHKAFGEVVGRFAWAGEWNRRPAFRVKERGGEDIVCRLTEDRAEQIGADRTLTDVWRGQHVRVIGEKQYNPDGSLKYIEVENVEPMVFSSSGLDAVLDTDFTGGLSSEEYINKLRGGDV